MKILTGKIVSEKTKGAAVVEVVRFLAHPLYRKRMRTTKRYHANNDVSAKIGDQVKIAERSPISRTVTWKVIEVQTKK